MYLLIDKRCCEMFNTFKVMEQKVYKETIRSYECKGIVPKLVRAAGRRWLLPYNEITQFSCLRRCSNEPEKPHVPFGDKSVPKSQAFNSRA